MLCQYKNVFGQPKQGFHKLRIPILDIALLDTLGTIAIIAILVYLTKVDWILVSLMMLTLTVFIHKLFCVPSNLENLLPFILILAIVLLLIKTEKHK